MILWMIPSMILSRIPSMIPSMILSMIPSMILSMILSMIPSMIPLKKTAVDSQEQKVSKIRKYIPRCR